MNLQYMSLLNKEDPTCKPPLRKTMTSDKVFDDCHFIKYNEPIKIEKKFPLLPDPDPDGCICPDSLKISASDIPPDICKMMTSKEKSPDEKTLKMLNEEFPMRIKRVGDDLYAATVRETQASPMELTSLLHDVRMNLIQRAARKNPLCEIREEILRCLSKELLRQLIIECPERGQLFKQVMNEYYKYLESYQVLMRHNEAFMCRKNLQAMHNKNIQLMKIQFLEDEIEVLKHQAKALKEAADRLEKKYQEERMAAEEQRQNEIRYLKLLGEQLKSQIEIFTPASDEYS